MQNLQTFHFNTGVKLGVNPYLNENAKAVSAIGGGFTMVFPFDCKDVPEKSKVLMLCDNPKLEDSSIIKSLKSNPDNNVIIREVYNTKMVSKYAYFETPKNN